MSCFNSNCYLPRPPRAWSRVQNSCSLNTEFDDNRLPYSNQFIPVSTLETKTAMLNKGNILQYKANSSNLTKAQKYSKIAKGRWINRNTTWATQSTRGYTNPNTTSLKRFGNALNCSVQENKFTGETKRTISQQLCNPTTDSNVPGPIQELCWNDGTPTWYPRQRLTMSNSTNKWPVNAVLSSSIIIYPPVITYISSQSDIITLTWTLVETCLPATNFNIYQNNIFVKTVPGIIFTTDLFVENCTNYEYYIIAENKTANIISDKSNVITISNNYLYAPTNVSLNNITLTTITSLNDGMATIQINWTEPSSSSCINGSINIIDGYNIYINGTFQGTTPNTTYTTSPKMINKSYKFTITTLFSQSGTQFESDPSNPPFVVYLPIIYTTTGSVTETYSSTTTETELIYKNDGTFKFFYDLKMKFTLVGGGGAGASGFFNVGTSAGGGGQILNSSSYWVVNSDTWNIYIGAGQQQPNENSPPSPGGDTSIISNTHNITNSNTVSTDNKFYSGGGGKDATNYSDYGGGGINDGNTSSVGGNYDTTSPASGGGGGGGSLTTIDQSGNILYTLGNKGKNANSGGGDGGDGQLGINNVLYGGGGGGGTDSNSNYGKGGNGGGGNGASTSSSALNGGSNTGGGGGGGYTNTFSPGKGGSGVVILMFTA